MQLPRSDQRWTAFIRSDVFSHVSGDPEFCALVTFARAVNSIQFVSAPILNAKDDSPRAVRDRYNSLLFSCALFAEVIPLVQGMQKYFRDHPAFKAVAKITNSDKARKVTKAIYHVRNKLIFHFDASEVEQQMRTLTIDNPVFALGLGTMVVNTYHELADVIALRALFGPSFPDSVKDYRPILQTVSQLSVSFAAAAETFIVTVLKERNWAEVHITD